MENVFLKKSLYYYLREEVSSYQIYHFNCQSIFNKIDICLVESIAISNLEMRSLTTEYFLMSEAPKDLNILSYES